MSAERSRRNGTADTSIERGSPSMGRRAFLGVAGGAVAGGILQACTPGTSTPVATAGTTAAPATTSTVPKTLTVADPFENATYDGIQGQLYLLRQGIGETLVSINSDRKIEPTLATALEPVDATTWRFTVRSGVRFHNGNTLDSQSVKASLERFGASKDAPTALQGMTVVVDGPSGGRIRTKATVASLPALLTGAPATILDESSFNASGSVLRPVGTGPYKMIDYKSGDRRVLQSHEAYWRGTPKIRDVQYRFVPNGQTRANLVRTGEVDIARTISPADAATLKTAQGVRLLSVPLARVRILYLNSERGPTADLRVRQALAHATDRDVIVRTVLENDGTPQPTLFRPEYPWGDATIKGLPFDRDRAKALLADAGYGPSKPLDLTLYTHNMRAELPLIAQVLQQQYAAVGANIKIEVQVLNVIESIALQQGTHNLVLFSRNPLITFDPQPILESDYSGAGSYNLSRYKGADDLISRAATTADTTSRYGLYRQIERRIIEQDVSTIAISAHIQLDAVREGIAGYNPDPSDLAVLTAGIDR